MDNSPDPAELARIHTRLRRRFNWLWFGAAVLFAGGGAITSAFTRNIYDLYGGLFFAVPPLIGLLLNNFVWLNPRRDPIKTQQRLEDLEKSHRKNARSVALTNGSILVISSPVMTFMAVCGGAQKGIVYLVLGAFLSTAWLVGGLLMIVYWWRTRPR